MLSVKRKHLSYSAQFKLKVVQFAEENKNVAAECKFSVSEKLVRDWRKAKASLEKLPKMKRACHGKAAKYPDLEKTLLDWICSK